ncbi:elongation factor P 5-aminopentanone reductase [Geomicrobium sediminis]|uniref:3-oxoacyl-[acyl-carrier protein] reductase n=1 Tax=Geomicrobium sediminis TaxID=1347788 RepID=A0ABS2PBB8_9BACL|nr:3-oxoacyl-[acyl-carrier protein] reductase [Geomicrobium sediminis]
MKQSVLITGASGGIGQAIATSLSNAGTHLFLHYFKGKERAEKLKQICEASGSEVTLIQGDLTSSSSTSAFINELEVPIDAFIHASGHDLYGLYTDYTDEERDALMHHHVYSAMAIAKRVLPTMIQKKSGRIILISSIWGEVGASMEVLYSTAKGAQLAFVKALAKEVAISGITVNAVSPGVVETNMMASFSADDKEELTSRIPAGMFGTPEQIASACSYLLTEEAAYVNGHVFSINGGFNG